eukprot:COSAG02_NODE_84_length_39615_cov_144.775256_12_plen_80_part_00
MGFLGAGNGVFVDVAMVFLGAGNGVFAAAALGFWGVGSGAFCGRGIGVFVVAALGRVDPLRTLAMGAVGGQASRFLVVF